MILCVSYRRLYKLTDLSLLDRQLLAAMHIHVARLIAMNRVADRVATEGKHLASILRTIRGYTLCKLHELWRGMEASHCSHAVSNHPECN